MRGGVVVVLGPNGLGEGLFPKNLKKHGELQEKWFLCIFLCFRLRLGQKQVHILKVNSKQFARPVFESGVWGVL